MFTGSMVAVATPMNDDGSIDFESFEKLIELHALLHKNCATFF